jgi:methionyl-tRNA synthetase
MALDLPLPRQLLAHAHWTLGKEKMSKTRNNGVNPFFAMERFGVDAIRYFLIYNGGIKDDASYDNARIVARYKDLKEGLGNLLNRIVRGKGWNVRQAVQRHETSDHDIAVEHARILKDLPFLVTEKIEKHLDLGSALGDIMNLVKMVCKPPLTSIIRCTFKISRLTPYQTNRYLQSAAPWEYAPRQEGRESLEVDRIIFLCAESLRIIGILLQPYIPSKMKHLLDILGVADDARTFEHAITPDVDYGNPAVDVGKGLRGVVFPHSLCDL